MIIRVTDLAGVTISGKSGITKTSEASVKINALSVLVTASVISQTFIDILQSLFNVHHSLYFIIIYIFLISPFL